MLRWLKTIVVSDEEKGRRINEHLVRWTCRKYKRLRRREKRAKELLARAARRYPALFAHWRFGLKPDGWTMGAV